MAESIKEANVKIHVKGLAKHFGRTEVLRDISTDIHEGEVVCIIGPSGGGKSTFLRCLNKLEAPSAGTVIVDGADICDRRTDINKVREKIGMVFQHFNLFNNYSVLDNLTLAPMNVKKESKAQAREKARKMLDEAGFPNAIVCASGDLDERLIPYGILLRHCDNYVGLGVDDYRAAVRLPEENAYLLRCLRQVMEEVLLWWQNR